MQGFEKLFDLLKSSGWQGFFLTIAFALFLMLCDRGIIDTVSLPILIPIVWLMFFISAAITLAALFGVVENKIKAVWEQRRRDGFLRKLKADFVNEIPTLTETERRILGYLREKNLKRFEAESTAGYGSTLLSKRYIQMLGNRGQEFDYFRVPFEVTPYVWEVITERPEDFPYKPLYVSNKERLPWVIYRG